MFSDSRHRWPARQELPARQISATLSRKKPNCFVESASWRSVGKKICRCQGVASAKPAWRQTGLDIYFLVRQLADWYFLACPVHAVSGFKTKRTIEKKVLLSV